MTAQELEHPDVVRIADGERAGRPGLEPVGRHVTQQVHGLPRGGALLQDVLPELAAVTLLHVGVGGQDGRVDAR